MGPGGSGDELVADAGSGVAAEDSMIVPGPPPWHMWGSSQRWKFVPPGFAPPQFHQLAKVTYRRPETWSFVFAGQLTGGSLNTSGSTYHVTMLFDIFIGIGRSVTDTQQPQIGNPQGRHAFAKLVWAVPNGARPGQIVGQDNVKYTTSVRSPLLNDDDPLSFEQIDAIAAQDINCRVTVSSDGEFQTTEGESSCYFAPRSHIRPDWFNPDADLSTQYTGGEIGGT